MTPSVPDGELRRLGDRAFLIGVADAAAGRALAGEVSARLGDAAEVVCGFFTVMVRAATLDAELSSLRAAVDDARAAPARGRTAEALPGPGRLVTVPCRFDGPDLDDVAALAGCRAEDVPGILTARPLTAAVIGFSPGFAYLQGLPRPLDRVPRRAQPRPAVPAGSVAIANGQAAVYPTASPGGWHLVGRTAFPLFSADRPPYAVLAPGDRVQFAVTGADQPVDPQPVLPPPWTLPADARPVFEVLRVGLRAVVQDGGRRAVAAVGVPGAGPADPVSFDLANRLVGNDGGAGALELTGGGTRLRCLGSCHVAVVGADAGVRVDGLPERHGQLLPLAPGQVLDVGPLEAGWRTYLAVAGQFLGPVWFGSSATDELTGLGGGFLAAGDVLHAGAWAPPLGDHVAAGSATAFGGAAPVALRVVPGPHAEQFPLDVMARLAATVFAVQSASNRVGIRLRAEGSPPPLRDRADGGTLDSQGVVTGAVQVPPDGEPVVLLPDHATLGGYPVVAVVAAVDHGLLGQCGPGTRVRFVPVDHAAAEEAGRVARRASAGAVVGTYPLAVD